MPTVTTRHSESWFVFVRRFTADRIEEKLGSRQRRVGLVDYPTRRAVASPSTTATVVGGAGGNWAGQPHASGPAGAASLTLSAETFMPTRFRRNPATCVAALAFNIASNGAHLDEIMTLASGTTSQITEHGASGDR